MFVPSSVFSRRAALLGAFFVGSMLAARANGIRLVDNPALPTFTTLQAAIDAAPDGGMLLVQAGTYGLGTIDGKSLSIVKMPGATSITIDSLRIRNLSSTQHVLLSGLVVHAFGSTGVELANDAGSVRLEDCTITGGRIYFTQEGSIGAAALDVHSSAQVVVTNCILTGGDAHTDAGTFPLPGGHGIAAQDSNVAMYDSLARGGHGGEETNPAGGDGGDGCHVSGWGIYASGCDFRGGGGGGGDYIGCNTGGLGGDAIDESNAQVLLFDSQFTAGGGGWSSCGPFAPGGVTVRSSGGIVNQIAGMRRKLAATSVSADDARLVLTITGQPGDRIYVARSWNTAFAYKPTWHGVWTVSPTVAGAPPAIVPPSGVLTLKVRALDIVGTDHRLEFLQAFGVDASGFQFLTGPVQIEYLDARGGPDCDSSSTNDFIQLVEGAPDCNRNIELDTCDITSGSSQDANHNGVPDECPGG